MSEQPENKNKIFRMSEEPLSGLNKTEPENVCIRCKEKRKANGTDYCSSCRKELEKIKPPVFGWVLIAVFVVAAVISLALSFMNFAPEKRILEARKAQKELRLNDAYAAYEDAFNLCSDLNAELRSFLPADIIFTGHLIRGDELKVYSEIYGADFAGSALSQYLTSAEIAADPELSAFADAKDLFDRAQKLVSDIFTACSNGEITCEEAVKKIKALEAKPENADILKWLVYYECDAELEFGDGNSEAQIKYMTRLREIAPEMSEIYDPVLIENYYNIGKYDECISICNKRIAMNLNDGMPNFTKLKIAFIRNDIPEAEKVLAEYEKNNPDSENTFTMKMMIARRSGDYKKALDYFQQGSDLGCNGIEFNRQQALNFLAKGDYTNAFNRAYNACAIFGSGAQTMTAGGMEYSTTDLFETLYLCAMLYSKNVPESAEDEGLHETMDLFTSEDNLYVPGEWVADILNGKTALSDALTKGTGDVT